jgi:hypothetical protein
VVFSGETRDLSSRLATKQSLTFPIVQDTGLAIARTFGLVFVLPDDLRVPELRQRFAQKYRAPDVGVAHAGALRCRPFWCHPFR